MTELEQLLEERKQAAARLEHMLETRTRELREALEQQAATADVLKAISHSPFELQSVLDSLLRTSARLCDADMAGITRQQGEFHCHVAQWGGPPGAFDYMKNVRHAPGRGSLVGRVLLERGVVQIPDALADPEYAMLEAQQIMGFRTLLGVPLLREGMPIGVFNLWRSEVRPFTQRQIELLTTFADQAVIAIENARLFDEVQARTRELSEALERQQAATEILHIIASSPNDAQPVFDTIARSVARLCDVRFCQVFRFDGELIHFAAHYGLSPEAVDDIRRAYPLPPGRASAVARAILSGTIAQIPDIDADPDYTRHQFAKLMNFRNVVAVPMLKGSRAIGAIAMARSEPGYFPERQITLLRTFADQAVIAIGNTRLFNEIQDKTRQLEIADKYKSHFLASASHDLRQPLHALNLFVAQLRDESDPDERERLVGRIDAAVVSMNELFESLLDMSKLEVGVLEPHLAEFPIEWAFKRIETTFADAARQKGLRLSVVPSGAWVRSDFILLERILMNLVSNAVRCTARGSVVVGCRRGGGRLRIDVCDSGSGIPQEQQQNIFGEYYRLAAAKPDGGGFGLGLAIVARLGRLLNHNVELESRLGRGSRFSVSVPFVAERHGTVETPVSPVIVDPARGKLVVVIDDDPLVLDGMDGILRSWGCQVLSADSEEAALSRIATKQHCPDLIIADYRLADGRTGIQVIEHLRDRLGTAVPAFLISGDTAPERLRDASGKGFHLLHKPVAPIRLRAMVNQLLKAAASNATDLAAK